MRDKVALLMEETGCERGEAELALELCGYDLQSAVQAVPRLFQNIVILKGRMLVRGESLYGLCLVILNLKDRSLLRARAVLSYNPAVFSSELDRHWFDFEARLYACRLWAGTLQSLSQEVEQLLASYFDSPRAAAFYEEGRQMDEADFAALRAALGQRLGGVELQVRQDVLDMGQFQEVRPSQQRPAREGRPAKRASRAAGPGQGPGGLLVLRVAFEPSPEGIPAGELRPGDLVYAWINDQRDIAQYLARLFGARSEGGSVPLLVPVEAMEKYYGARERTRAGSLGPAARPGEIMIRVRLSAGICGDVSMPSDIRLRAVRRPARMPWWKKIFGR